MAFNLLEHVGNCIPGISLDCVVFGYKSRQLHVLLLKYRNNEARALPGGFLPRNKEMDEVVNEILYQRTGLKGVFLKQFHTFSSVNRSWDCNELSRKGFEQAQTNWSETDRPQLVQWFNQRFISTAYFALIDCINVVPVPDAVSEACDWVPIDNLPQFILDHERIVNTALNRLRQQVNYLPLGRELLPERFTLIDLQMLYESILGKKLDRGNFRRKITQLGVLIRHEKLMTGAQNKAPHLYSINNEVYDELLEKGIGFG